jgi:hypothetical protein
VVLCFPLNFGWGVISCVSRISLNYLCMHSKINNWIQDTFIHYVHVIEP